MTLNDILQSAQGGAGLKNLAAEFGLTQQETQAAVQAILPALSRGLRRAAETPRGLSGVIGEMASGVHAPSYSDPSQTRAAADVGAAALARIFGDPDVAEKVSLEISRACRLAPQLVGRLLPAVASMALGGLSHALQAQGHGDVLAQPARGGDGGLIGSIVSAVEGALGGATDGDLRSGLAALVKMFAPGVAVAPDHARALDALLPR
jgi:hypothetical protein